MKLSKQEIGKLGEKLACDYLMTKGYKIRETNFRTGHSEIDIIAESNSILVFVEVKTRSDDSYSLPEESVDQNKENQIASAATEYMHQINYEWEFRFDVVSLLVKNGRPHKIKHYVDAFFPGMDE